MNEQFPPPAEGWEQLCRDVPALRAQLDQFAEEQHAISRRLSQMADLDRNMVNNIEELSRRQLAMHAQMTTHAGQLAQVLRAHSALAGSPSGFVGLAQDVGGSVRMTKRLWKAAVGVATGAAALLAAFHYGQTTEKHAPPPKPPVVSQPAPVGEE